MYIATPSRYILEHTTKVIYRCNHKYDGEKCKTPHVTEEEVKAAFVSAYNQLVNEKKEIIANGYPKIKSCQTPSSSQNPKGTLAEPAP